MTCERGLGGVIDPTAPSRRPFQCPPVMTFHSGVSKLALTPRRLAISLATSMSKPTSSFCSERKLCGGQPLLVATFSAFVDITRSSVSPARALVARATLAEKASPATRARALMGLDMFPPGYRLPISAGGGWMMHIVRRHSSKQRLCVSGFAGVVGRHEGPGQLGEATDMLAGEGRCVPGGRQARLDRAPLGIGGEKSGDEGVAGASGVDDARGCDPKADAATLGARHASPRSAGDHGNRNTLCSHL